MLWFKKESASSCCDIRIEEVKEEKSPCCDVKIEEVKEEK